MRPCLLRLVALALLVGLSAGMNTERAEACGPGPISIPEALDEADVVFAGTVVAEGGVLSAATFRVSRVWKGELYATRFVGPAGVDHGEGLMSVTSCDRSFEYGEHYQVYGYYDDEVEGLLLPYVIVSLAYSHDVSEVLGEGRAPEPGTVAPAPAGARRATAYGTQAPQRARPGEPASIEAPGTGTGTVSRPYEADGPATALFVVAAVVLSVSATRRRART